MIRSQWRIVGLALLGGAGAAGCNGPAEAGRLVEYERIRAATATEFGSAIYYKPAESGDTNNPLNLPPLIIQESPGRIGFDHRRPAVFSAVSTARIHGRTLTQLSYWWNERLAGGDRGARPFRGFRMTLDSQNRPLAWELIGEERRPAVVYVSRSLERGAAREFGGPLPGRRYSIERSMIEQPNVVVARVLEDGPQPMGPYVYVTRSGAVTTLACRCMESQFRSTEKMIEYDVLPRGAAGTVIPMSLPEMNDPNWLERGLRWPTP